MHYLVGLYLLMLPFSNKSLLFITLCVELISTSLTAILDFIYFTWFLLVYDGYHNYIFGCMGIKVSYGIRGIQIIVLILNKQVKGSL
jgi:hypothetical protein